MTTRGNCSFTGKVAGWILDVYPVAEGMCVWIIDAEGRTSSYLDPWSPCFYLGVTHADKDFVERIFSSLHTPIILSRAEKFDFFTKESNVVVEVRIGNPLLYAKTTQRLAERRGLSLYNADLNLGQYYFYERGLFPLARVRASVRDGAVLAWELNDSPWELDYPLPPLTFAHLSLESVTGDRAEDPRHGGRGVDRRAFVLTLGETPGCGTTYVFDSSEEDLLLSFNRHLEEWDPDVLLTSWGDSVLFPQLAIHSERTGIPLRLSRDPDRAMRSSQSRQYTSYGKVIHQAGARTLFGRLHIDVKNLSVGHSSLSGLFEVARMAKIPLQRAARSTIGTSLSSLQHEWANKNGYLIPLDKGQTEDFRPADELIAADRGGLVYEPEMGWHDDLVEFDFSSMYAEIMIRNNVTPEAVNCRCCPENKVPEIGHHLCRQRGMVPAVLEPIVRKRAEYKKLIKEGHPKKEAFKSRYDAFKWALVTCFGYLGYRNARFGRIEAHECVNAYSREALLQAKETAEAAGFHFVHAIVDSLWLRKPSCTDVEVEALRKKIEGVTGLPLGLEGRYKWIRFLPSKTNALVGVPNRYFGAFVSGEIKVRGLELRRHDTPQFIKDLQERLIRILSQAKNVGALGQVKSEIEEAIRSTRDRLHSGHMLPEELAITVHLSKSPSEYVHDTLAAIAAKKLESAGVQLEAGESLRFIVSEGKSPVKDWRVTPVALIEGPFEYDLNYYVNLMNRAIEIVPGYEPAPIPSKKKKVSAVFQRQTVFSFLESI